MFYNKKCSIIPVLDDRNVEIIGLSSTFYDNLRINLARDIHFWAKSFQHIACSGNKRNSITLELE